jgi:hypothetical protein
MEQQPSQTQQQRLSVNAISFVPGQFIVKDALKKQQNQESKQSQDWFAEQNITQESIDNIAQKITTNRMQQPQADVQMINFPAVKPPQQPLQQSITITRPTLEGEAGEILVENPDDAEFKYPTVENAQMQEFIKNAYNPISNAYKLLYDITVDSVWNRYWTPSKILVVKCQIEEAIRTRGDKPLNIVIAEWNNVLVRSTGEEYDFQLRQKLPTLSAENRDIFPLNFLIFGDYKVMKAYERRYVSEFSVHLCRFTGNILDRLTIEANKICNDCAVTCEFKPIMESNSCDLPCDACLGTFVFTLNINPRISPEDLLACSTSYKPSAETINFIKSQELYSYTPIKKSRKAGDDTIVQYSKQLEKPKKSKCLIQ